VSGARAPRVLLAPDSFKGTMPVHAVVGHDQAGPVVRDVLGPSSLAEAADPDRLRAAARATSPDAIPCTARK
jgi:hypothetical protein